MPKPKAPTRPPKGAKKGGTTSTPSKSSGSGWAASSVAYQPALKKKKR